MCRALLQELAVRHLLLEVSQVLLDLVEEVLLQDSLRSQDSNSHPDPHHRALPLQEDETTEYDGFMGGNRKPKFEWRVFEHSNGVDGEFLTSHTEIVVA
jgi:hypothetical protein